MFLSIALFIVTVISCLSGHRIGDIHEKLKTINDYCLNNRPPTHMMQLYNRMVHSFLTDEIRRDSHHLRLYLDRVGELMEKNPMVIQREDYTTTERFETPYVEVNPPFIANTLIAFKAKGGMGKRTHRVTEWFDNMVVVTLIKLFFPRDVSTFLIEISDAIKYVSYLGDEDKWSHHKIMTVRDSQVRSGNWTECDRFKILDNKGVKKVCLVLDESYVIHENMDKFETGTETELYVTNMINYTSSIIRETDLSFFLPELENYRLELNAETASKLEILQIDKCTDPISMPNVTKTLTWMLPPESRLTLYCMGESLEYFYLGYDQWMTSFSMSRNHTIRDLKLPASIMTRSSHIVVMTEFKQSLWMAPPNETFNISPDCRATYYTYFEHKENFEKFCHDFPCTHNILVL